MVMPRQITDAAKFVGVELIVVTEIILARFIEPDIQGKCNLAPVYAELQRSGPVMTGWDAEGHLFLLLSVKNPIIPRMANIPPDHSRKPLPTQQFGPLQSSLIMPHTPRPMPDNRTMRHQKIGLRNSEF